MSALFTDPILSSAIPKIGLKLMVKDIRDLSDNPLLPGNISSRELPNTVHLGLF